MGTVPNGLGWSPDGALLYFADSPTRRIDVFDYDLDTGTVRDRRLFADLSSAPGNPDGLTVDEEGRLWVAIVRGGCLLCLDPLGHVEETIALPVSFVTSCAFGGDDLSQLYITSGCLELEAQLGDRSLAGALFRVETNTHGIPTTPCQITDFPSTRFE